MKQKAFKYLLNKIASSNGYAPWSQTYANQQAFNTMSTGYDVVTFEDGTQQRYTDREKAVADYYSYGDRTGRGRTLQQVIADADKEFLQKIKNSGKKVTTVSLTPLHQAGRQATSDVAKTNANNPLMNDNGVIDAAVGLGGYAVGGWVGSAIAEGSVAVARLGANAMAKTKASSDIGYTPTKYRMDANGQWQDVSRNNYKSLGKMRGTNAPDLGHQNIIGSPKQ